MLGPKGISFRGCASVAAAAFLFLNLSALYLLRITSTLDSSLVARQIRRAVGFETNGDGRITQISRDDFTEIFERDSTVGVDE